MEPMRLFLATLLLAGLANAAMVRVVKTDKGFQLLRDGKPYLIKGAGGSDHLDRLAASGGNSIRTWDAKGIRPLLDRAHKLGLTVTVGIWLGQERHGFDYTNADAVHAQLERARGYILELKDHPALLAWGIGNEVEGDGNNAAVWLAVNQVARMAKQVDPNHPTLTVIAELGGKKVQNLHRFCPDIDIVGINSYGGITSVAERYRKAGGTKPYVITEFGPIGQWEVEKTAWGAPVEQTSTAKAIWYRQGYSRAVFGAPGLCLGSYVFLWGHKQEATATWFGMFLPDGTRTGAVDAMSELWSNRPPANRCPEIAKLTMDKTSGLKPGDIVTAALDASDSAGDPLKVEWVVRPESGMYNTGGDAQEAMPNVPDAVIENSAASATVRAPKFGGGYRLFAYVRDDKGGGAVANVPFHVDGPKPVYRAPAAKLPLVLYADGLETPPYTPSGWMGNTDAIAMDDACETKPRSGKTCLKVEYKAADNWGGVVWQSPPDDWGDRPGGFELSKAKRLTFWVRGEAGGETVECKLGILGKDKPYHDTATATSGTLTLTTEWQQITIDLAGRDLTVIKTGFVWVVAGQGKPVTFYLDDIQYE
jgi:hypothetical protein